MRRFLLLFFLLSIVLAFGAYFTMNLFVKDYPVFLMFLPVLVVAPVSLIAHLSLYRLHKHDPKRFVRRFLLITTLRLLAYMGFILVFVYLYQPVAKPFLLQFLLVYFCFLVFEVTELTSKRNR